MKLVLGANYFYLINYIEIANSIKNGLKLLTYIQRASTFTSQMDEGTKKKLIQNYSAQYEDIRILYESNKTKLLANTIVKDFTQAVEQFNCPYCKRGKTVSEKGQCSMCSINFRTVSDLKIHFGPPPKYAGLRNYGVNCFVNCVIQQLFMNIFFRYTIMNYKPSEWGLLFKHKKFRNPYPPYPEKCDSGYKIIDATDKQYIQTEGLWRALANTFKELELARNPVDSRPILNNLHEIDTEKAGDATASYASIIMSIDLMLNKAQVPNIIRNMYMQRFCTTEYCGNCKNPSSMTNSIDGDNMIRISPTRGDSLHSVLKKMYNNPEQIKNKCTKCKNYLFSKSFIYTFPNVIVMHMDRSTGGDNKTHKRFEFPEILDLYDYSYNKHIKNKSKNEPYYFYYLVGVVLCNGETLKSSHFWSHIRERYYKEELIPGINKYQEELVATDNWYIIDDDVVTTKSKDEMIEDWYDGPHESFKKFGVTGNNSINYHHAYLLFYERRYPEDIYERERQHIDEYDTANNIKIIPSSYPLIRAKDFINNINTQILSIPAPPNFILTPKQIEDKIKYIEYITEKLPTLIKIYNSLHQDILPGLQEDKYVTCTWLYDAEVEEKIKIKETYKDYVSNAITLVKRIKSLVENENSETIINDKIKIDLYHQHFSKEYESIVDLYNKLIKNIEETYNNIVAKYIKTLMIYHHLPDRHQ
jgi:hypothetical protein